MANMRKDAAMRRASARAKGRERTRMATPGRMVEAGVGWGNIARGVARIVGGRSGAASRGPAAAAKKAAPAAKKATPAKKTTAKKATPPRRPRLSEVTTASERRDIARMKTLRNTGALARKRAAAARRTQMQGRIAGGAAAGVGAAGIGTAAALQRTRRPKGKMPIRPKGK